MVTMMIKPKIYPKELEKNIRFNTKYIPRKINNKERLIYYHRYWIGEYDGIYKLSKIEEYLKIQYYYLESKSTSQLYTYPINEDNFYELMTNDGDLLSKDIIDNKTRYKGYEIKYWFYKNWNKKYKDFEKYLIYNSPSCIDDNSEYIVQTVIVNYEYRSCKIVTPDL